MMSAVLAVCLLSVVSVLAQCPPTGSSGPCVQTFALDATQAGVPSPANIKGWGMATVVINYDDNMCMTPCSSTLDVAYQYLTGAATKITVTVNGTTLMPWASYPTTNFGVMSQYSFTMTNAQYMALTNDDVDKINGFTVNIFTAANPNGMGEVSGLVESANLGTIGTQYLYAYGSYAGVTNGCGKGSAADVYSSITWDNTLKNPVANFFGVVIPMDLSSPCISVHGTAAHVHGPDQQCGTGGGLLFVYGPITSPTTPPASGAYGCTMLPPTPNNLTLTWSKVNYAWASMTYINVHSSYVPGGEVRGAYIPDTCGQNTGYSTCPARAVQSCGFSCSPWPSTTQLSYVCPGIDTTGCTAGAGNCGSPMLKTTTCAAPTTSSGFNLVVNWALVAILAAAIAL